MVIISFFINNEFEKNLFFEKQFFIAYENREEIS